MTTNRDRAPKQQEIMEFIKTAATELDLVGDIPLSFDARITTLGIDSVSLVEIVGMLEEEFSIRLPQAEFQAVKTLGDLIALVERQAGMATPT